MRIRRQNPVPIRLNPIEREMIVQAADMLHVSLTEFVRVSAVNRAKHTISRKKPNEV